MWWASFGLSCQLSLYPFKPKKPECWLEMSTTYDVELDNGGGRYYDYETLPGATEVLLKKDVEKKTNDKR